MKTRYRLFYRGNRADVTTAFDNTTGKRTSLKTKDKAEAARLLIDAKNEAATPARHESATCPGVSGRHATNGIATRTWQHVLDEITSTKTGANQDRWQIRRQGQGVRP